MNQIKKLAGQTAIYGVSTIIGRLLNVLLVPLYTYILKTGSYGTVTEMYAYVAILIVVLTYGMETAFFRYSQLEKNKEAVYSTSLLSIGITTLLFLFLILNSKQSIAEILRYPNHSEYILWFALIISFDVLASIPYARLRAEGKATRFATIRITGIVINIGLNLFFILLCPFLLKKEILTSFVNLVFDGEISIKYIFISNLISSSVQLLMLSPEIIKIKEGFNFKIWRKLINYAWPLLIFGLAGNLNEMLDRILIKYLMPADISMAQLGIYGACYKISIFMTIFIQAFRYAAEPFFFAQASEKNAKELYAEIMKYFVIVVSFIFLGTMMYLQDVVIFFIGPDYREGAFVIPILLMANLFLGIFYNLSIWYKLTNKTIFGAYLALIGAAITIILNIYWIPRIGYLGSAWATFICYAVMMVLSYLLGQKYYRVKYDMKGIIAYLGFSIVLYFISTCFHFNMSLYRILLNTFLLLLFVIVVSYVERNNLKQLFLQRN